MRGAAFMPFTNTLKSSISTHAPHARRGIPAVNFRCLVSAFLLTRLMRGAAIYRIFESVNCLISTHAPHARRGTYWRHKSHFVYDFYSRASCEARHSTAKKEQEQVDFYSRASCEARRNCDHFSAGHSHFYSRASCEARRQKMRPVLFILSFLLTRLMRGAAPHSL